MCVLSCCGRVQLFASPWTVACQVPLSMGFSRQEYWSGLPMPFSRGSPPRDQTHASCIAADSLPLSHGGSPLIMLCLLTDVHRPSTKQLHDFTTLTLTYSVLMPCLLIKCVNIFHVTQTLLCSQQPSCFYTFPSV